MARRILYNDNGLPGSGNPLPSYKFVGYNGLTYSQLDSNGEITPIGVSNDLNVQTVSSSSSVTPTTSNDLVLITNQSTSLTIENPSGVTASEGKDLVIRIKDNGSPVSILFGTKYRAFDDALPITTVSSKTLYLGIVYNAIDDKWDVIGISNQL
jgi:hypothetical protein